MASISLGPLVLPGALPVLGAAVLAASVAARLLRRRLQFDAEPLVWRVLLCALVAARLGFVLDYAAVYASAPWQVLNLRDGGWSPLVGWGVAWACTVTLAARRPAQRRALWATMGVASAVGLAGAVLLAQQSAPQAQAPRLPPLTLVTLEGGGALQPLSAFAGRPVVLNLWATWCPPCVREMPVLARAQQRYPGVHFVFANQSEAPEKVQRFLATHGLALQHVLLDERGALAHHFQQRALPTTLFFDASGALVDTRTGELSDATLAQRLARWPGAATAPPAPASTPGRSAAPSAP